MMTPNTRLRVSILERLAPSFAFAVAALSGAVGVVMFIRFFSLLQQSQIAGYASFFGGMAEVELVVGVVLVFAAVLGAIGILVSIIRLFTTNTTASPPGLLFLMMGLLSVVAPFAVHYVLHRMKEVVRTPGLVEGGASAVAGPFMTAAPFVIGAACVVALGVIAFSFIPFSSRAGRKASPLVCLMLVEILIVALAGVYFWEARGSFRDRDMGFVDRTKPASESSTDTNSYESDLDSNTNDAPYEFRGPVPMNSNSRPKMISGGVLNGKAIEFPQPEYPPAARAVRATGSVSVQVTVDEKGEVISATAVSGHPLLRSAAVQAARQARFEPTKLSGQPVKVSGVLTYNFSGQ